MQGAQLDAANAHCTIAQRHIAILMEQLTNKSQTKRQKSKKIEAHFVTLPELRAVFEAEEAELAVKEAAEAEKAAQKRAEDEAWTHWINQEIAFRVFDAPLSSYKHKDDLVALAGALSLPMQGTAADLTKAIKDYLRENPSHADEPCFSGLFGNSRWHAVTQLLHRGFLEAPNKGVGT
ncbi:hypothetical protein EDD16DRAFT_1492337 [Pisolithus croceorrhizus]|nr:hypothetical protein EDD16DRAFT_1492337 [Pisolithus croceorrhizus]KAI6116590.1 hypothetical protein EV401DRAFT_1864599 [Pisolithus croceorrhizus]KAI6159451.1 hypothetical protein EDD17DRAFT_1486727 [Pisolithus thermaeus]